MLGELWQSVSLYTPLNIVAAIIAAAEFQLGIATGDFKEFELDFKYFK